MDNLYCSIVGGQPNAMIKVILRITFFVLLVGVKDMFGMDIALIFIAVVVVSDLESIERALKKKFGKDCK